MYKKKNCPCGYVFTTPTNKTYCSPECGIAFGSKATARKYMSKRFVQQLNATGEFELYGECIEIMNDYRWSRLKGLI